MRQLIKRIIREEREHEKRLLGLIDQYIAMTYPNAIKVELSPPGGHIIMTSLIKNAEDVENGTSDDDDVLIHKMDAYNMPHVNINKEFLMSVKSMFGGEKSIKNVLEKWFDNKPVDVDLLGSSKQEQNEGLHDTFWQNDEGDKITLVDLLGATEDIPVKNISVEKLKSKLLTWDGDDSEIAKIEKADLQYPILIFVDDDGELISIIDGHHRVHKAVKHKLKSIKAKLIPINSLPNNIKKVFGHLSKQEQNESELTERCWKGYTQKGMKTMFGKRYPNCVKKKKKSVNETSIRDILKKFAGFTATDDKQEFQKIVDIITKITKKNNPVDGMIGVAVVDVVKEMWGQTYTDPKSLGSRWDFSVVLRPLFPENYIDKVDGSQLENFKKEFLSNTRGMGFEIVSPVTHEKVKNYKVNYIFSGVLWIN